MADDRLLSRRGWALVVALLVGAYIVWISIPATRQVEGSWVTDFSDRRKLVGYADAVFVGRVIERTEEVADLRWPSTRFRVEVLEVIKSTRRLDPSKLDSEPSRQISLPSSVIVDQYGGYTRDLSGKLVKVVFDGQELLEPGRTYVLATSYDADRSWYHVLPMGAVPADDAAARDQAVDSFRRAAAEQIPYEASAAN